MLDKQKRQSCSQTSGNWLICYPHLQPSWRFNTFYIVLLRCCIVRTLWKWFAPTFDNLLHGLQKLFDCFWHEKWHPCPISAQGNTSNQVFVALLASFNPPWNILHCNKHGLSNCLIVRGKTMDPNQSWWFLMAMRWYCRNSIWKLVFVSGWNESCTPKQQWDPVGEVSGLGITTFIPEVSRITFTLYCIITLWLFNVAMGNGP